MGEDGVGGDFKNESPQKRQYGFPFFGIIGEFPQVPAVMCQGTGEEIGGGPQGEGRNRESGGGEGEARPFEDFAEDIGAGDVAEQSALRDFIARFTGFAELDEPGVRPKVDAHAQHEQ